jgi:hypothetical protein
LRWRLAASCCMPRRQGAPAQDIRIGRETDMLIPLGRSPTGTSWRSPAESGMNRRWTAVSCLNCDGVPFSRRGRRPGLFREFIAFPRRALSPPIAALRARHRTPPGR